MIIRTGTARCAFPAKAALLTVRFLYPVVEISTQITPGQPAHFRQAVACALASHAGGGAARLTTDVLEYGALSAAACYVEICSEIDRDDLPQLRFAWTERHGPVVMPPTPQGRGTRLIERSRAEYLGDLVKLDFLADGPTCVIATSLAHTAAVAEVPVLSRLGNIGRI